MTKKLSKRVKAARGLVDAAKQYSLDDAIKLLKEYREKFGSKAKDETVEIACRLGIDARRHTVRSIVPMPSGLGKEVRIAVVASPERIDELKSLGVEHYGAEDLIDKMKSGMLDFDVCIATPDMMAALAKLGKILGPKGLMPNPKLGTVTTDLKLAVKKAKAGQVEFKTEKAAIVHAGVGKLSFSQEDIKANIAALYNAVLDAKPADAKGTYMRSAIISCSQGPAIKLDLATISS
jgi:large subunit ribosomal protein L1